jgi:hypothetical protein
MIKFFGFFATILAVSLCSLDGRLQAQAKKAAGPIKGTAVSVEKAKTGRSYTLTIKAEDDTEYEVPLLPRTQVTVTAKTDYEIIKVGMIVEDPKLVDAGGDMVSEHLTVLVGVPFAPQLLPVKAAEDEETFHMVGQVRTAKPHPRCLEGSRIIEVDCGARTIEVIYPVDMECAIKSSDPTLIKKGDSVEIDGTIVKGRKQISAKTVSVIAANEIDAAAYYSSVEEAKKNKSSKPSTKAKTAPKEGATDETASDNKKAVPAPLKNKKSGKPNMDDQPE